MLRLGLVISVCACVASTEEPLELVVDGERLSYDRVEGELARGEADVLRLTIVRDSLPGVADAGWSTELVVELQSGVDLSEPLELTIAGDATFVLPEEGTSAYIYPEEDITFATREGHSASVRRAWLTYRCFCTGYGDVVQSLDGTVVLEAVGENVHGRIELDGGALPFWGGGFETSVPVSLSGPFETR